MENEIMGRPAPASTIQKLKRQPKSDYDEIPEDEALEVHTNINDIFAVKQSVMKIFERMQADDRALIRLLEQIDAHGFYNFDRKHNTSACGENWLEKTIDQKCWHRMVDLYQLEKYMLCTEYDKLSKQIADFNFPVFNLENAEAWLDGLKRVVYESVQKLIEDVFNRITEKTYHTGSSYSTRKEKKRNNNGIDKHFILTVYDNSTLSHWNHRPTLTDDLEKACYIIDGKTVPEKTIKAQMSSDKTNEGENAYFAIKVCKNGNTHYRIKDAMRAKLNLFGAKRGVFGENIRIKIFEKKGY